MEPIDLSTAAAARSVFLYSCWDLLNILNRTGCSSHNSHSGRPKVHTGT